MRPDISICDFGKHKQIVRMSSTHASPQLFASKTLNFGALVDPVLAWLINPSFK